jgi:hypothetical protein
LPSHVFGVVFAASCRIFQCARELRRHDLVVKNRSQIFALGLERSLWSFFVNEFFVFSLKLLVCTQWQYLFCNCVLWNRRSERWVCRRGSRCKAWCRCNMLHHTCHFFRKFFNSIVALKLGFLEFFWVLEESTAHHSINAFEIV